MATGCVLLALLAGLLVLIASGLRAGDRVGDAVVLGVAPQRRDVRVTVGNPGAWPVLVGLSLRRPGLRLRLEAGSYVSRRRRAAEPLPEVVGVLGAGETGAFAVPAPARLGEQVELLVVVGQEARLRAIHRAVRLPEPAQVSRRRRRKAAIRIEAMA